jgi:hypothetical protein
MDEFGLPDASGYSPEAWGVVCEKDRSRVKEGGHNRPPSTLDKTGIVEYILFI